MKTESEIDEAIAILVGKWNTPGIDQRQKILIMGMVNALAWVADGKNCDTMDDLLDGRPLAIRQPDVSLN